MTRCTEYVDITGLTVSDPVYDKTQQIEYVDITGPLLTSLGQLLRIVMTVN